jgi:hypothetical protein
VQVDKGVGTFYHAGGFTGREPCMGGEEIRRRGGDVTE